MEKHAEGLMDISETRNLTETPAAPRSDGLSSPLALPHIVADTPRPLSSAIPTTPSSPFLPATP
eukprot:2281884-Rhodomonas_salina.1